MTVKPTVDKIFVQISGLLEHLSNEEYSQIAHVLNGSSIGQHVRHTLEFFKCLFDGAQLGEINYDQRKRDIFLESNTLQAKALLDELSVQLSQQSMDKQLVLIQCYGEAEVEENKVDSTVLRELIYNIEHAVHHLALIRIGLKEVKPDLVLDPSFGVANSTVRHQRSQATST
jgi:uncharacterized damage-inducible protein DinB